MMLFEKILREKRIYAFMFVVALFLGFLPMNAKAMPVDSKAGVFSKSYESDLKLITKFLEEERVTKKLAKLGLSSEQIRAKLDTLDERQIHSLAIRIKSLEKAGSATVTALIIVATLLVIVLFLYQFHARDCVL